MKIGKLFMLAIALVLAVALVAAVLTACEPDTPIDSKGTVADIASDLKQKCNMTFSVSGTSDVVKNNESVTVFEINYLGGASTVTERTTTVSDLTTHMIKDTTETDKFVFGTHGLGFVVDVTVKGDPVHNGYNEYNTVDMTVTREGVDGTFDARDRVAGYVDRILGLLRDGENGAVFNESADVNSVIGTTGETYIQNTGEATVSKDKIKFVFSTQNGDVTTKWTCTLDNIGNTKITVPADIDALADYRQLPGSVDYDISSFGEVRTAATAVRTERRAISAFSFGARRARVFRGGEGAAEIVFAKGKGASAAGRPARRKPRRGARRVALCARV